MKRRPTPTAEDLDRMWKQAQAGRGGPLADFVKSLSRDMLAKGFSRCGPSLPRVLAFCAGMLEERDRINAWRRAVRRHERDHP